LHGQFASSSFEVGQQVFATGSGGVLQCRQRFAFGSGVVLYRDFGFSTVNPYSSMYTICAAASMKLLAVNPAGTSSACRE